MKWLCNSGFRNGLLVVSCVGDILRLCTYSRETQGIRSISAPKHGFYPHNRLGEVIIIRGSTPESEIERTVLGVDGHFRCVGSGSVQPALHLGPGTSRESATTFVNSRQALRLGPCYPGTTPTRRSRTPLSTASAPRRCEPPWPACRLVCLSTLRIRLQLDLSRF